MIFAGLGVLVAAELAFTAWLLLAGVLSRTELALVVLGELVLTVTGLALAWAWFELRVFRALRVLAEDVLIMARSNPGHRPNACRDDTHALGVVAGALEELSDALLHARTEMERVMHSASVSAERRSARLEAILRDLTEGVVVCNLEHRIVLFNQAAERLLAAAGALGLGRDLSAWIPGETLDEKLALLDSRRQEGAHGPGIVEFTCSLAGGTQGGITARMSLVLENGRRAGYVLSLRGAPAEMEVHGDRMQPIPPAPPRPEFYDFDLFEHAASGPAMQRPLTELDYVVFDTETTGMRPSEGDEIVQIGAVRVINRRILTGETFDRLVNPGRPVPPWSTRIHGITEDMVGGAARPAEVLREFHRFAGTAVLVAHNAAFDMKFLSLKESEAGVVFDHPVLDTFLLSLVLHPNQTEHTLEAIAARFGVQPMSRHSALGDAMATAEVFVRMIDLLQAQNVRTLGEAVDASNRIFEKRRLQAQH